jgi:arylsulfatase A-like enzyme
MKIEYRRMNKYLIALASLPALESYAADQPNILIIMADQLTARVLSCYGGPVNTPNIDRIANQGILFRNAICTCPFSSPSRASLITGQYPHKHGILHNCMNKDYQMMPGPPTEECICNSDITTEKILNLEGYATHQFGKWHLTQERLSYYPDMYGEHINYAVEMKSFFDSVRLTPAETWMDWYKWALPVSQSSEFIESISSLKPGWSKKTFGEFVLKMGRLRMDVRDNFDYRVASKTIEAIKINRDKAFMISCSFNAPHDPNVAPSPYYEMFNPDEIVLPENFSATDPYFTNEWSSEMAGGTGESGIREFLRIYYANVRLIDDQVGRILRAVEDCGIAKNTIIIFTADHGDMAASHGMVWKSTSAFFNEVVRVPLIIMVPGLSSSRRISVAVSLTDVMPTIMEVTGNKIPASCQGHSLYGLLTGKEKEKNHYPYAFCERVVPNPGYVRRMRENFTGSYMVMSKEEKYIEYPDGKCFYYDLRSDPGETKNQSENTKYLKNIRFLREELNHWLERTR